MEPPSPRQKFALRLSRTFSFGLISLDSQNILDEIYAKANEINSEKLQHRIDFISVKELMMKNGITIFNGINSIQSRSIEQVKWSIFKLDIKRKSIFEQLVIHAIKYKLPSSFFNGILVSGFDEKINSTFMEYVLNNPEIFEKEGNVYPYFDTSGELVAIPPLTAFNCLFCKYFGEHSFMLSVIFILREIVSDQLLISLLTNKLECIGDEENKTFVTQRVYEIAKLWLEVYSKVMDDKDRIQLKSFIPEKPSRKLSSSDIKFVDSPESPTPPRKSSPNISKESEERKKSSERKKSFGTFCPIAVISDGVDICDGGIKEFKVAPKSPAEISTPEEQKKPKIEKKHRSISESDQISINNLSSSYGGENKEHSRKVLSEVNPRKRISVDGAKTVGRRNIINIGPIDQKAAQAARASEISPPTPRTIVRRVSLTPRLEPSTVEVSEGERDFIVEQINKGIDLTSVEFVLADSMKEMKNSSKFSTLIDVKATIIAEQLFIFDLNLIKEVTIGEIIQHREAFDLYLSKISAVDAMISCFIDKERNSKIFNYFIKVAFNCLKNGEYNMSYLICCIVENKSTTYKSAFENIKRSSADHFKELKSVFSIRNVETYISHFESCDVTKIPIMQSDVCAIVDRSKGTNLKTCTDDKTMNFQFVYKLRKLSRPLKYVHSTRMSDIPYKPIDSIQQFFNHLEIPKNENNLNCGL